MMKKLQLIPLFIGSLLLSSCGEESSESTEKKETEAVEMTVCGCKEMIEEMQAKFDNGEDADTVNKEYLGKQTGCFELKKSMGKEAFNEAIEACE